PLPSSRFVPEQAKETVLAVVSAHNKRTRMGARNVGQRCLGLDAIVSPTCQATLVWHFVEEMSACSGVHVGANFVLFRGIARSTSLLRVVRPYRGRDDSAAPARRPRSRSPSGWGFH